MVTREKILVHACCASCSTHVLSLLSARYEPAVFFFNPNIQPEGEYRLRLAETTKVCGALGIPLIEGKYDPLAWDETIAPWRDLGEKSERCWACYRLRLEATAAEAARRGTGIFTTTLSVSPHKIYERILIEGEAAARRFGVAFLGEDFKKKDGFRISVEQSRLFGLTRQDYCGCLPSREEAARRRG